MQQAADVALHLALDAGHQLLSHFLQLLVYGSFDRLCVNSVAAYADLAGQLFRLSGCCLHTYANVIVRSSIDTCTQDLIASTSAKSHLHITVSSKAS